MKLKHTTFLNCISLLKTSTQRIIFSSVVYLNSTVQSYTFPSHNFLLITSFSSSPPPPPPSSNLLPFLPFSH